MGRMEQVEREGPERRAVVYEEEERNRMVGD